MPESPRRRVQRDDDMPERMKLGNKDRPARVPPPAHAESIRVSDENWETHNRRRDAADAHADERAPQE